MRIPVIDTGGGADGSGRRPVPSGPPVPVRGRDAAGTDTPTRLSGA